MNRADHVIHTLPQAHRYPTADRLAAVAQASEDLQSINAADLKAACENVDGPEAELVRAFITQGFYSAVFLPNAIFEGRRLLHAKRNVAHNVYRMFFDVAIPFLSTCPMVPLLERMATASSYSELAAVMRAICAENAGVRSEVSEDDKQSIDVMLAYLEDMLTRLVNTFLAVELSLTDYSISSFCEDAPVLLADISKSRGDAFGRAYSRWELATIGDVIHIVSADTAEILFDDPSVTAISQSHSFTYVDLFNDEIGYDIRPGESMMIQSHITPWLYNVAESLYVQSPSVCTVLHDLLITKDNVIYELHKGALATKCFMITKVIITQ